MRISFYCFKRIRIYAVIYVSLIASNLFAQTTSKPNIIFILADDIGYLTPTINGGESYSTPNIDSMARQGMNFTRCEATPLCCTSRSMFLTGKYLNRNYSNWGYLNESEKTIGNVMKDAGYVTGIFGKWQFQYSVALMHQWGWDTHILFELTEDTMAYRRYKNPVLRENGYRIPDNLTINKYCDDILTERILKFIDSNKNRPFFAYYSMSIGHDPFGPTPDDPGFVDWNPKHPSDTGYYPSMIRYMDKKIGAILKKLRITGLMNNTLVVYAGDNGTPVTIYYDANGIRHIKGEKGKTTEGGTHVPLITYWPGHIQPGSVNDDLVDFADFLPTFAQAGKLKNLDAYGTLDGISFYPKIVGKKGKTKKQLYCFYDPENQNEDSLKIWARDKTYKLYDSTGVAKSGKFYNITKDPQELLPLNDNELTVHEKSVKANLKLILDTSYSWPNAPRVVGPSATAITSSSAIIGATIILPGASKLMERGSAITATDQIFLSSNRLRDGSVQLGKFSQKRIDLKPQTQYKYLLYAMNNNKSHSTGSVQGEFLTLSAAVVQQPLALTATSFNDSIYIEWTDAVFPGRGASKGGYLLVYSTGKPVLTSEINGKSPAEIIVNGKFLTVPDAELPLKPVRKVVINSLSEAATFNFILIPYTWNGLNSSTYNYLINGALAAGISPTPIAVNIGERHTDNLWK